MKCPHCKGTIKKVMVAVHGATQKVQSLQCQTCHYFAFEPISSSKVVEELRQHPLKIRHKIVKLSKDRLGIYFNSNIVRSLGLQKGEEVYLSIPNKKQLVMELSETSS